MITTPAELESMEKFFAATTLPKVFKLNAATTIYDLPGYVNKIIAGIKTQVFSDTVAIRKILISNPSYQLPTIPLNSF